MKFHESRKLVLGITMFRPFFGSRTKVMAVMASPIPTWAKWVASMAWSLGNLKNIDLFRFQSNDVYINKYSLFQLISIILGFTQKNVVYKMGTSYRENWCFLVGKSKNSRTINHHKPRYLANLATMFFPIPKSGKICFPVYRRCASAGHLLGLCTSWAEGWIKTWFFLPAKNTTTRELPGC